MTSSYLRKEYVYYWLWIEPDSTPPPPALCRKHRIFRFAQAILWKKTPPPTPKRNKSLWLQWNILWRRHFVTSCILFAGELISRVAPVHGGEWLLPRSSPGWTLPTDWSGHCTGVYTVQHCLLLTSVAALLRKSFNTKNFSGSFEIASAF